MNKLTDAQAAQMDAWADRWIEIGLRTGDADRPRFEAAVADCYRFANLAPPKKVVWVPSPLAAVLAGPIAAQCISTMSRDAVGGAVGGAVHDAVRVAVHDAVRVAVCGAVHDAVGGAVGGAVRDAVRVAVHDAVGGAVHVAVHDAVHDAVRVAVHDAVRVAVRGAVGGAVHGAVNVAVRDAVGDVVGGAVDDAVNDAVRGAVGGAVHGAVSGAVHDAVDVAVHDAVRGAVHDAVRGAVGGAVHGAVSGAVNVAVRDAVGDAVSGAVSGAVHVVVGGQWMNYMGGQFWCGGWYYGVAFTSFFREICQLNLNGDIWARARAYEATVESACWWWPHSQFVMVSERPLHIHRELTNPAITRGPQSHRLHSAVGPAVLFRDGLAVWSWHGVRVTEQIIMAPETLTTDQIAKEKNAQVRQVMVERIGIERVCQMFKATCIDRRGDYELLLLDLGDGRKRPYLKMINPSVPGLYHIEGVHPNCKTVQQSINWRAGNVEKEWQPEILT